MSEEYQCAVCKEWFSGRDTYEHRGQYSCSEHLDEMRERREFERQEVVADNKIKTEVFRGLDLDPSNAIGKANQELLKGRIEIASKEGPRERNYIEGGNARKI